MVTKERAAGAGTHRRWCAGVWLRKRRAVEGFFIGGYPT